MSNIDWLEKRRRAARCKIHGLHYDPSMTSGCVLCRKEGLLREKPKGPQLIMLLLALLGMTLAAFQIYGPVASTVSGLTFRTFPTEAPEDASTPQVTSFAKLDPNRTREAIQQFETALINPRSDDLESIRENLSTSGQILSLRLRELDDARGQEAASDINGLLDFAASKTLDLRHLEKIRFRWFEARARNFQPAPWFLAPSSSADLDRAQLAIYRDIAKELQTLVAEGEQTAPAPKNEEEAQPGAWNAFRSDWRGKIEALQTRLPERPSTSTDVQLLLVVQQLEQSLEELNRIASSANPPANADSRFKDLDFKVQQALRTLDDLLL